MLKKTISLFLLSFLTQTVLAGIDLHHASVNNNSIEHGMTDIFEHYVDTHNLDYSVNHQCDSHSEASETSIDSSNSSSNTHHHDCHGHTTPYTFIHLSIKEVNFTSFFTYYTYILNDYSVILDSPKRPPIFS